MFLFGLATPNTYNLMSPTWLNRLYYFIWHWWIQTSYTDNWYQYRHFPTLWPNNCFSNCHWTVNSLTFWIWYTILYITVLVLRYQYLHFLWYFGLTHHIVHPHHPLLGISQYLLSFWFFRISCHSVAWFLSWYLFNLIS